MAIDDARIGGYDPRAIANLLIEYSLERQQPISNLPLQKVLYFAHALYLIRHKKPLISGYFEAWKYGPVHPVVYNEFKQYESQPITEYASRLDIRTRMRSVVSLPSDQHVRSFVKEISDSYGMLSPSQLVEWSHRPSGPWHTVVGPPAGREGRYGLRITNETIISKFHNHRLTDITKQILGEFREEQPPSSD